MHPDAEGYMLLVYLLDKKYPALLLAQQYMQLLKSRRDDIIVEGSFLSKFLKSAGWRSDIMLLRA